MAKTKKSIPSEKSIALEAERKLAASVSAINVVDGIYADVTAAAIKCLDDLVSQLEAWDLLGTNCCVHLRYCLGWHDPSATIEALAACWQDDVFTHKQYFTAVGLWEECKNTLMTIQDQIGISMIVNPHFFLQMRLMDIPLNLRARLLHAHRIMQRYVSHVGAHLMRMGKEAGEPELGRPAQASSSICAPPGLMMSETTPLQDLLEQALVELRPWLDNLSAAGWRAKGEAKYELKRCAAGWRKNAEALTPGSTGFSAKVWIRSVAEPQQERALVLAIILGPLPIVQVLAHCEGNSAICNALKDYVHIQVPSANEMQDLVMNVLKCEPTYYDIIDYSAYVNLLGLLLAGTAKEQWAQQTGLLLDPEQSLLASAIDMMVSTSNWRLYKFKRLRAQNGDFLHEVFVALTSIFEGATSLGEAETQILDLATWFIKDYREESVSFNEARTLLRLAGRWWHTTW
jgi:hypothetical protein